MQKPPGCWKPFSSWRPTLPRLAPCPRCSLAAYDTQLCMRTCHLPGGKHKALPATLPCVGLMFIVAGYCLACPACMVYSKVILARFIAEKPWAKDTDC